MWSLGHQKIDWCKICVPSLKEKKLINFEGLELHKYTCIKHKIHTIRMFKTHNMQNTHFVVSASLSVL